MKKFLKKLKGIFKRKREESSEFDENTLPGVPLDDQHTDPSSPQNEDGLSLDELVKQARETESLPEESHDEQGSEDFELKEMQVSDPYQKGKVGKAKDKFQSAFRGIKDRTQKAFTNKGFKQKASTSGILNGFSVEDSLNKLFSPELRPKLHKAFITSLILIGTYSTGKLAALFLKPDTPVITTPNVTYDSQDNQNKQLQDNIRGLVATNPFKATEKQKEPKPTRPRVTEEERQKICRQAQKSSRLPIKLLNTTVLQDSVKSIASVQIRGENEPVNVREGENINNMAKIGKIDRLKLVFKNLKTGDCEYVANVDEEGENLAPIEVVNPREGKRLMEQARPDGIKTTGNVYTMDKEFRDKMLEDISTVLTQAKAVQIQNPDGSLSFKMTEIVPGSIYTKLGIEEGDIVTTINGKKINNLNELMTQFGKISKIDHFEIGMKRNGMEINKEYNFQ